jgi:hypothetical protein
VRVPGQRASDGREWISVAVVAVGASLVAFAAWPRRSTTRSPSAR